MLGLKLFMHAFQMLFHDLWVTVRITLFPLIIGYGLAYVVMYLTTGMMLPGGANLALLLTIGAGPGVYLGVLVALAIIVFTFCWSAVGWHRYALLSEQPGAYLPTIDGALIKAYFGASVRFFLLLLVIFVPALIILQIVLHGFGLADVMFSSGAVGSIISIVLSIVVSAFVFRFTLVLPAAALGKPITLRQSYNATAGYFGALIVISIASTVPNYLAGLFTGGAIAFLLSVIFSWLSFALGIAVLTTLYGYCIEKRALD